jgi:hypothetical protein
MDRNEDILWFNIPVDESLFVNVRQSLGQLEANFFFWRHFLLIVFLGLVTVE